MKQHCALCLRTFCLCALRLPYVCFMDIAYVLSAYVACVFFLPYALCLLLPHLAPQTVWYYPNEVFVDKEMLAKSRFVKADAEYGKAAHIQVFT
eukprot:scaffold292585_cov23-Tisochrysis_lutea.AAC.4